MSTPKLKKTLFWDTDKKKLDYKRHQDFIIGRVLLYGDFDDFKQIKQFYGLKTVKEAAERTRYLDRKSLNFWSVIFSIPKNKFLCFKTHSQSKLNPFLNR